MRTLLLLPAAVLVLQTQLLAQAGRTGHYARYARAIETVADSVVHAFDGSQLRGNSREDAIIEALAVIAPRVTRFAGDFDAVQPPTDLGRLHQQLVDAGTEIAARVDSLHSLTRAARDAADPAVGLRAARLAEPLLSRVMRSMANYLAVRERATRMLEERGVTLAPFR